MNTLNKAIMWGRHTWSISYCIYWKAHAVSTEIMLLFAFTFTYFKTQTCSEARIHKSLISQSWQKICRGIEILNKRYLDGLTTMRLAQRAHSTVTCRSQCLLHDLVMNGYGWDILLSDEKKQSWDEWQNSLQVLQHLHEQRTHVSRSMAEHKRNKHALRCIHKYDHRSTAPMR